MDNPVTAWKAGLEYTADFVGQIFQSWHTKGDVMIFPFWESTHFRHLQKEIKFKSNTFPYMNKSKFHLWAGLKVKTKRDILSLPRHLQFWVISIMLGQYTPEFKLHPSIWCSKISKELYGNEGTFQDFRTNTQQRFVFGLTWVSTFETKGGHTCHLMWYLCHPFSVITGWVTILYLLHLFEVKFLFGVRTGN